MRKKYNTVLGQSIPLRHRPTISVGLNIGIAVLIWLLVGFLADMTTPKFGTAQYAFGSGAIRQGVNPVLVKPEPGLLVVHMPVDVGLLRTTRFHIHPDDCLEALSVNGVSVENRIAQFCDHSYLGPVLDLSKYMKHGQNIFRFTIRDFGGLTGIRVTPARNPIVHMGTLLIAVILCLWIGISAFRTFKWGRRLDISTYVAFLFGAVIRVLYVLVTPHTVRGHDTDAHIQYIEYVARYFSIPPASGGWEYHQAPLYYFITGQWYRIAHWFGFSRDAILGHIQFISLSFSVGVLCLAIWMAYLLFPKAKTAFLRTCFVAIIAVFPGIVFLSARISNDALAVPMTFLIVCLLLRWWQHRKMLDWYLLCTAIGIGICTKVSAAVFVPVAFCCLLLLPTHTIRSKIRDGAGGAAVIGLLTLWLFILRFILEADVQNSLTFGSQVMHHGLRLPTTLWSFLVFDPAAMFLQIYNDPWDNAFRRQYFWEYLFRSAFFGEFHFDPFVRIASIGILCTALVLLPLALIGFGRMCMRWKQSLPLLLTTGVVLFAHIAYRLYAPFSSNQDFRFSTILVVPFAYVLLQQINSIRTANIRIAVESFLFAFIVCCAGFFLLLALL